MYFLIDKIASGGCIMYVLVVLYTDVLGLFYSIISDFVHHLGETEARYISPTRRIIFIFIRDFVSEKISLGEFRI